jgi:chromosome segregation ATPase
LDETTEKMRKAVVLRDETEKELAKTRDVVASLKAEITTKSSAFDPRDVELDSLHAEAAELRADLQRSRDEMSRMNAEVASLRHLKAAAASSPSPGGGGAASRAEVDELRARVSVLRYWPFMDPPIRELSID